MAWHKCCYSSVRSHPMITLSEAASIKTCETISASTSHSAENDANSFERILQEHLPLVRSIVDRMKRKLPTALEVDELYSIGLSGLIAAARNYSQSKVASFASYASTRIRGAILDELRRSDWMSRRTRSKAKQLGITISKLEQERGGVVSQEDLCAEMKMTAKELAALQDEVRELKFVSLDEDETDSEYQSLHEIVPDESCPPAFVVLERKEALAILAERMTYLPDVQKRVLAMYYYENMKIAQIAGCFGVTESRICQIHTQTLRVLRAYMSSALA
jgi:RNA polymerase sigma factor for flagellar operon FliA